MLDIAASEVRHTQEILLFDFDSHKNILSRGIDEIFQISLLGIIQLYCHHKNKRFKI